MFVADCHAVLGIDAGWTEGNPSSVALIAKGFPPWRCLGVAPSYESFVELASGRPVDWSAPARGGPPDLAVLQAAARKLAGYKATLIAVDMPLSKTEGTGRRPADDEIRRQFGAANSSVHCPLLGGVKPPPSGGGFSMMRSPRERSPGSRASSGDLGPKSDLADAHWPVRPRRDGGGNFSRPTGRPPKPPTSSWWWFTRRLRRGQVRW